MFSKRRSPSGAFIFFPVHLIFQPPVEQAPTRIIFFTRCPQILSAPPPVESGPSPTRSRDRRGTLRLPPPHLVPVPRRERKAFVWFPFPAGPPLKLRFFGSPAADVVLEPDGSLSLSSSPKTKVIDAYLPFSYVASLASAKLSDSNSAGFTASRFRTPSLLETLLLNAVPHKTVARSGGPTSMFPFPFLLGGQPDSPSRLPSTRTFYSSQEQKRG